MKLRVKTLMSRACAREVGEREAKGSVQQLQRQCGTIFDPTTDGAIRNYPHQKPWLITSQHKYTRTHTGTHTQRYTDGLQQHVRWIFYATDGCKKKRWLVGRLAARLLGCLLDWAGWQCGSLSGWWVSWWLVWVLSGWGLSQSGETRVAGGDMYHTCHLHLATCLLLHVL